MRKTVLTILCVMLLLIAGSVSVSAASASMLLEYDGGVHEYNGEVYALVVKNREIDPPLSPIIFNDRALVPVREIFEEVGATVSYDVDKQAVTIYNENTTVVLYINNNIAYINGKKVAIPDNVVPKLISKLGGETKTMVPVRFISESMGMPVDFDAESGAILIASEDYDYSDFEPIDSGLAKPYVTGAECSAEGEAAVMITVDTDNPVENIADFTLDNPGRLVVDLNGAGLLNGEKTYTVNKNGVTTVRFGDNGERARIVVDSEYISGYNIETVSDNEIKIKISTKVPAATAAPVIAPLSGMLQDAVQTVPTATPQASAPTADAGTVSTAHSSTASIVASKGQKLVVLDAGHGGTDSGAVGALGGVSILEKDLTLSITYKVKAILEQNGIMTAMTRDGDTLPSLVERPTQANAQNAALFVSIHINSVDNVPTASGIETYYSEENNGTVYGATSAQLAKALLDNMVGATGAVNRGVKTANHAVTRRCLMPASLVECGFISNYNEVSAMTSDAYQNQLAQGIAQGIIDTLPYVNTPN